jgi:hypothetical protein
MRRSYSDEVEIDPPPDRVGEVARRSVERPPGEGVAALIRAGRDRRRGAQDLDLPQTQGALNRREIPALAADNKNSHGIAPLTRPGERRRRFASMDRIVSHYYLMSTIDDG